MTSRPVDSNVTSPRGKRGSFGRGRGRGHFRTSLKRKRGGLSLGTRHNNTIEADTSIPIQPDEDHADRLWSHTMLSNLLHCGKLAEERQKKKNISTGNKGQDFAEILYQEWKNIYPNSTMNSRNIKSRLSVYKKTLGDFPHPTKRRKLDAPSGFKTTETKPSNQIYPKKRDQMEDNICSTSISLKEHFSSMLTKKPREINTSLIGSISTSQQTPSHVKPEVITAKIELDEGDNNVSLEAIKSQTAGLVDEVNDEFVPENTNSSPSPISGQHNFSCHSDSASVPETVKVEFVKDEGSLELGGDSSSRSSPSLSRRVSVEQACSQHWCHVFHDRDKEIECVLTQQLLDIRKHLEPQFPGCNIYSPRKPKGELHIWRHPS